MKLVLINWESYTQIDKMRIFYVGLGNVLVLFEGTVVWQDFAGDKLMTFVHARISFIHF